MSCTDENEQQLLLYTIIEIMQSNIMFEFAFDEEFIDLIQKFLTFKNRENGDLIELISNFIYQSIPHKELNDKIGKITNKTTWWNIGFSICSITPNEQTNNCEVSIRDSVGNWSFNIKEIEMKQNTKLPRKNKIEGNSNEEFKLEQKNNENKLKKKLSNINLKDLEWKYYSDKNKNSSKLKQLDSTDKQFSDMTKFMNSMINDTELINQNHSINIEKEYNSKKYIGYISTMFLQYPNKQKASVKNIKITNDIKNLISKLIQWDLNNNLLLKLWEMNKMNIIKISIQFLMKIIIILLIMIFQNKL